ncbi:MAG: hypothetical protein HWD58_05460 [Bacteroidota bacterium]|nr:MAG: hypothetical protein HWD58_05460 [Bacteroidota bacterium]
MRDAFLVDFLHAVLHFSMQAQVGLDILEGPVAVVPCNNNCDTLHANFPKPLKRISIA